MQKNDNSIDHFVHDEKYQLLIEAIDEGVVLFEPASTQVVAANFRFFELIGHTRPSNKAAYCENYISTPP
jgi:hypothetical protein